MARLKRLVVLLSVALLIVGAPTFTIEAATATEPEVITTLRGGDLETSLRLDWWPMVKSLASGKVPGDKYTWDFENSPLYIESEDSLLIRNKLNDQVGWSLEKPALYLYERVGEVPLGLFDVGKFNVKTETRPYEINGKTIYRCAVVEYGVGWWKTPYGAECSKSEALGYISKCQKAIVMVAKKLKSAKYKGKPLSTTLKFKFVHDWLIVSADYDEDSQLKAEESLSYWETKAQSLWNEYGALVDGKTVCQGYSFAFKAIVDEYNRQTGKNLVCDVAHSRDHAWNRVKLGGKWYNVDLTDDDYGPPQDFTWGVDTQAFLVSDREHECSTYSTFSGNKEKATSRKFEGKEWPIFRKSLKECTVSLKHPNKVYKYKGKQVLPEVVVRYGKNVIPKAAYKVVRTDRKKSGTASFKIVPSRACETLKGSKKGPTFKIKKAKAKKTKK